MEKGAQEWKNQLSCQRRDTIGLAGRAGKAILSPVRGFSWLINYITPSQPAKLASQGKYGRSIGISIPPLESSIRVVKPPCPGKFTPHETFGMELPFYATWKKNTSPLPKLRQRSTSVRERFDSGFRTANWQPSGTARHGISMPNRSPRTFRLRIRQTCGMNRQTPAACASKSSQRLSTSVPNLRQRIGNWNLTPNRSTT
jgi:hypothetical protein